MENSKLVHYFWMIVAVAICAVAGLSVMYRFDKTNNSVSAFLICGDGSSNMPESGTIYEWHTNLHYWDAWTNWGSINPHCVAQGEACICNSTQYPQNDTDNYPQYKGTLPPHCQCVKAPDSNPVSIIKCTYIATGKFPVCTVGLTKVYEIITKSPAGCIDDPSSAPTPRTQPCSEGNNNATTGPCTGNSCKDSATLNQCNSGTIIEIPCSPKQCVTSCDGSNSSCGDPVDCTPIAPQPTQTTQPKACVADCANKDCGADDGCNNGHKCAGYCSGGRECDSSYNCVCPDGKSWNSDANSCVTVDKKPAVVVGNWSDWSKNCVVASPAECGSGTISRTCSPVGAKCPADADGNSTSKFCTKQCDSGKLCDTNYKCVAPNPVTVQPKSNVASGCVDGAYQCTPDTRGNSLDKCEADSALPGNYKWNTYDCCSITNPKGIAYCTKNCFMDCSTYKNTENPLDGLFGLVCGKGVNCAVDSKNTITICATNKQIPFTTQDQLEKDYCTDCAPGSSECACKYTDKDGANQLLPFKSSICGFSVTVAPFWQNVSYNCDKPAGFPTVKDCLNGSDCKTDPTCQNFDQDCVNLTADIKQIAKYVQAGKMDKNGNNNSATSDGNCPDNSDCGTIKQFIFDLNNRYGQSGSSSLLQNVAQKAANSKYNYLFQQDGTVSCSAAGQPLCLGDKDKNGNDPGGAGIDEAYSCTSGPKSCKVWNWVVGGGQKCTDMDGDGKVCKYSKDSQGNDIPLNVCDDAKGLSSTSCTIGVFQCDKSNAKVSICAANGKLMPVADQSYCGEDDFLGTNKAKQADCINAFSDCGNGNAITFHVLAMSGSSLNETINMPTKPNYCIANCYYCKGKNCAIAWPTSSGAAANAVATSQRLEDNFTRNYSIPGGISGSVTFQCQAQCIMSDGSKTAFVKSNPVYTPDDWPGVISGQATQAGSSCNFNDQGGQIVTGQSCIIDSNCFYKSRLQGCVQSETCGGRCCIGGVNKPLYQCIDNTLEMLGVVQDKNDIGSDCVYHVVQTCTTIQTCDAANKTCDSKK